MSATAKVKINGEDREINLTMIGADEVISTAMGLISDPTAYMVSWKHGSREGRLLPSERMYPEDGMEFTVSRR